MKIFIPTSNKTIYLVEALLTSLPKYWPEYNDYQIIILGYDAPKFKFSHKNISFEKLNDVDDVNNWAIDLKRYFETIDDDYFIFMNDDCPLSRDVNADLLNILIETASLNKDGNIGRICLTKDVSNRTHTIIADEGSFQIIEAPQSAEYRTSTQFSIWNRKYFMKHAKENMTPWQFELQSNPRNDGYRILGTNGIYCLDFYHLHRKYGTPTDWNLSCYERKDLASNPEEYKLIQKIMNQ